MDLKVIGRYVGTGMVGSDHPTESLAGGNRLICDSKLVGHKYEIKNVDKPISVHVPLQTVRP